MTTYARSRLGASERGYALLGLIIAMMVLAVTMTAAAPSAALQAKRQREIEMYYRGEQMAEAIARYYTGGKLSPAGVVVRTPPPPYGYLTELRKLRDGVTVTSKEVYFVRGSAFVDPLTGDEWEPIRIGDPRLRKFFRAWSQSTGRQLPPIYASYLGAGNIVDTSPDAPSVDGPGSADPNQPAGPGGEDDEDEDWEDEDEDEDWEDEDEDDGEEDESRMRAPSDALFVRASFQELPTEPVPPRPTTPPTSVQRPRPQQGSFFSDGSTRMGPIVGVVSKGKGTALRTRFGIEKYEEMIFIYIPAVRTGVPGQQNPAPGTGPTPNPPAGPDNDGSGVPDNVENPPPAGGSPE